MGIVMLFGLALVFVAPFYLARRARRSRVASILLQLCLAVPVALVILFGPWGIFAANPLVLVLWLPNALSTASQVGILIPFGLAATVGGLGVALLLRRWPRLRPAALFLTLTFAVITGLAAIEWHQRARLLAASETAACVAYEGLSKTLWTYDTFAAPAPHAEAIFGRDVYYWSYRYGRFEKDYTLPDATEVARACVQIKGRFTFSHGPLS